MRELTGRWCMQLIRLLFVLSVALGSFAPGFPADRAVATNETQAHSARALTADRPLRMAYYYPADQAAERSLRSNLGRMDIIAPHWLTVDETGKVHAKVPAAS